MHAELLYGPCPLLVFVHGEHVFLVAVTSVPDAIKLDSFGCAPAGICVGDKRDLPRLEGVLLRGEQVMHLGREEREICRHQIEIIRRLKVGVRSRCLRVVGVGARSEVHRRPAARARDRWVLLPIRPRRVQGDRWVGVIPPGVHPQDVGPRVPGRLYVICDLSGAGVGHPWADDVGIVLGSPPAVIAKGKIFIEIVALPHLIRLIF